MPRVTEAHSAARRQEIIDAAYRCFARKGFHQTTMRDIYAEANLSPGAIYHYFDSKDAIIRASYEFDSQRGMALFEAALLRDDPIQALRELIDFFYQGLESAAELAAPRVNVQGWGEALVNPALRDAIRQVFDRNLEALRHIVAKAQASGEVNPTLDPGAVARMLLSLYYGLELQLALYGKVDVEQYATAVKTLLFASAKP
ncbi:MAG: TetR/AcrR family transcriptional regulator [Anaerolineae bacterium]|nr:TetR/AcrR family transcriptional regulator [Anaerolineae bacterium]